ncbi:MAG: FISUMP domain-containing protein [Bacteroidales bacterium]
MNILLNKRTVISIALHVTAVALTFGQRYGQTAASFKKPAFSVLWNNADLTNKKLFVEIMYDKQTCFQDAAEFWLYYGTDSIGGRKVKIDSLLNNQKNCKISADSFILSEPMAGGYRLRFALNNDDTIAANEAKIRVVSRYQTVFSCKGCGAAASDVVVDSTSIHPACPYNNVNFDLLACTKRTGGAKNWEGFIVDHRDCKIYRMVAMPHIASYNKGQGRWWMAQNLNYTKNLINNPTTAVPPATLGSYYCPNAASFKGRPVVDGTNIFSHPNTPSNIEEACKTYGAVYGMQTTLSLNGLSPTQDAYTGKNSYSIAQGICPKGWIIPGRKDWAVMMNKTAGCDDTKAQAIVPTGSTTFGAPCNHLYDAEPGNWHDPWNSVDGVSLRRTSVPFFLRTTLSGRMFSPKDSISSTVDNPTWMWLSSGAKRHNGSRAIDYYGFSLLPTGRVYHSSSSDNSYEKIGRLAHMRSSTASSTHEEAVYIRRDMDYVHMSALVINLIAYPLRCVRAYNLDQ